MPIDPGEAVALFRFHLIAEAVEPAISAAERGLIIRGLASFAHQHPDGTMRTYSRGTLDRWVRAYRALNNAAVAALIAAASAGKALVDDACAKKAVAELTRG